MSIDFLVFAGLNFYNKQKIDENRGYEENEKY